MVQQSANLSSRAENRKKMSKLTNPLKKIFEGKRSASQSSNDPLHHDTTSSIQTTSSNKSATETKANDSSKSTPSVNTAISHQEKKRQATLNRFEKIKAQKAEIEKRHQEEYEEVSYSLIIFVEYVS